MILNPFDNPLEGMFPVDRKTLLCAELRDVERKLSSVPADSFYSYELLSERNRILDELSKA